MPSHFFGLSRTLGACSTLRAEQQPISLEMAEFWKKFRLFKQPLHSTSCWILSLEHTLQHSIRRVSVKFSCQIQNSFLLSFQSYLKVFSQNSSLFQCYLKIFTDHNLHSLIVLLPSEVRKKTQVNLTYYCVMPCWDSDQLFYVWLSVFGEKISVVYLGSKIFLSRTQVLLG